MPSNVKVVIIGEKYEKTLYKPLDKYGIRIICLPNNKCVDERLSSHADISVFHAGGERIWLAPHLRNSDFAHELAALGSRIEFAAIEQCPAYPGDAQLNIAALASAFIYAPKVSYSPIVDYLTNERGFTAVASRQGYAKCSVLVVDERSIITQDRGIARAARTAALDVLEISPGYVSLDGFEYGFLGGAGFKLSDDTLAFTGTLDTHPDKERILGFLAARGIHPVYLTDQPVFDIGSAIPIIEK